MPDTKISALIAVASLSLTDEMAVVQSGATKKTTMSQVRDIVQGLSHKQGNVVFLWPSKLGPYANVQAAFDAVPRGGELRLMEDMDLSIYNSNNPIYIKDSYCLCGSGSAYGGTTSDSYTGVTITLANGGTDCIHVWDQNATPGRLDNVQIRNLNIEHNGSGAGIRLSGTAKPYLENIFIHCRGFGDTGIYCEDGTNPVFLLRASRIEVRMYKSYGIRDVGAGSQNFWRDVLIGDKANVLPIPVAGIYIAGHDKHIIGGEYSTSSPVAIQDRTGIKIVPRTGQDSNNVTIENMIFEGDFVKTCIEIGDTSTNYVKNARVLNCAVQSNKDMTFVKFNKARDCIVENVTGYAGSNLLQLLLAVFTADSLRNTVRAESALEAGQVNIYSTVSKARITPYIDNGTDSVVEILHPANEMDLLAANATLPLSTISKANIPVMDNLANQPAMLIRSGGRWKGGHYKGDFMNPDDVTTANCLAWLQAGINTYNDAGVTAATDTDSVQEWHDVNSARSATIQFTQTTASKKPIYDADVEGRGHTGIQFNGASLQELIGPAINMGSSAGTIIAVGTLNGIGTISNNALIGRDSGADQITLNANSGSPDQIFSAFRVTDISTLSNLNNFLDTDYITTLMPDTAMNHPSLCVVGRYDGGRSPSQKNMTTGRTVSIGTATGPWSAAGEAAPWYAGSSGNGNYLTGWLHAFALFDSYLSDPESFELMMYFANRFHCLNAKA